MHVGTVTEVLQGNQTSLASVVWVSCFRAVFTYLLRYKIGKIR